ncbi:hypothetical protein ACFE04_018090 [Oxalis oulophora]
MALGKLSVSHVPERYILSPLQRPSLNLKLSTALPIVDLSHLQDPALRSHTIDEIRNACKAFGFFQVINHGITPSVMNDALDAATEFFNLPFEVKELLASDSVHEPVRYGTSLNHATDKVYFWRDFIKHYSHPISKWIHLWPSNPPSYKEKMGIYSEAVEVLQRRIMEAVLESLGLINNYLHKVMDEEGSQVIAVNCYPACPEPELTLGMPPHSDYGTVTILLQSCPGLQVMDKNKSWVSVPVIEGSLIVQLGDQMEVMSNGRYKSTVHQVTVSAEKKRISIASLHSLSLNKRMGPARELIDDEHPECYKEFSFKDFLDYISSSELMKKRYIDTLKMN